MEYVASGHVKKHDEIEGEYFSVTKMIKIKMSDGTQLAMDIYFPESLGNCVNSPRAVILERTPYNRKLERFSQFGSLAAQRGYIFIVQDVRGRFDSEGHFHMMTNIPTEGDDGRDTVHWIQSQPWFNGDLITVGGSFSAANQQALALHKPECLRAQILRDAGNHYYQRMFRYHGAFNIGVTLAWALDHGKYSDEAQSDPQIAQALHAMGQSLGDWLVDGRLQRGKTPLALIPVYEDVFFSMMEKADDEPYWHNTTVRLKGHWHEYPTDIDILLISGWFAHHANANLEKFIRFKENKTKSVSLLMGPWIHSPAMGAATTAGDADFGDNAGFYGPVNKLWLDWLDGVMGRAVSSAIKPNTLHYFRMGEGDGYRTRAGKIFHGGQWFETDVWPPQNMSPASWYLGASGTLSLSPSASYDSYTQYIYDPDDPCPGIGATSQQSENYPAFITPGPRNQICTPDIFACNGSSSLLEDRSDVVVFRSEPLTRSLEITGPVTVRLWVSSSAVDTDFVARLIDEYPVCADWPKGNALLLSEGILRMRYRDQRRTAELIEPDELYEISIELNPTSNLFKAGNRIRIDISSSSFPGYDVNPNTGEVLGKHTHTQRAVQKIFHNKLQLSRVDVYQADIL